MKTRGLDGPRPVPSADSAPTAVPRVATPAKRGRAPQIPRPRLTQVCRRGGARQLDSLNVNNLVQGPLKAVAGCRI